MTSQAEAASSSSGPPAASFKLEGFGDARLNQVYTVNHNIQIGARPTYWDPTGGCFMYYQDLPQCLCWAICPLLDEGKSLLHDVQSGSLRGLAFELYDEGFHSWSEYSEREDAWTTRRLTITPLPSPVDDARTAGSAEAAVEPPDPPPRLSLPAKLLKDNPHVEEILFVRGHCSAKLLVRFNAPHRAGEAAEVGRQLLRGCKIDRVEAVPTAQFSNLRQESQQRRRASEAQVVEAPQKRQR